MQIMAKPPKQAHNGVEEAIDAGAHQLVTSMEQRHSTPERGHSLPDLGQNTPERGHSTPDLGQSTPDLGHSSPERGQSTLERNNSAGGPRWSRGGVYPSAISVVKEPVFGHS